MKLNPTKIASMGYHPACVDDLKSGRVLFQAVGQEMVECVISHTGHVSHRSEYLYWKWKGTDIGGSCGHLHVKRYASIDSFLSEVGFDPSLWVKIVV